MHRRPGRRATEADPSGLEALRREFARSRRFDHPLTLVGIRVADPTRAREGATVIRQHVRDLDTVWHDDGTLYLLLPETDRAAAERVLARISQAVPLPLGGVGSATFPHDALTIEATLEAARSPRRRQPDPGRVAVRSGTG